ncbi:complex I 24 kDa subunit family protein [Serpentinicella alkaliphila]|uniref:NAD(P)-dependent iron-only hydrogenase diaphorase component iron-sulfur protein n=1 Tax=Serpentinicella alkaliphila TaxID=1734049 RepID=A0A4R2TKV3_9FIRM|nr:NAD(P)H-dependent oxidoreductase subunit E [Serpentinicella alkaliphila]QUH24645.1 NAD(P)H-dependent oxidoreductase subunit E [Serpentinicella alkaliphila]TCQ03097.1 NAD(P)-dependent iron-only hydrogenase diaphorase component iron-sulfur protein [Serpentinicella alkaliphila]
MGEQHFKLQQKNDLEQVLPKEKYDELADYIRSLDSLEGKLIQVLYEAQRIFGYLPRDVQLFVARRLGLSGAEVNGVVTFYSYFVETPKGEHSINVCTGTACFVKGANKIVDRIERKLNVKLGETSKDGKFTLNGLRCVGACGLAPVVIVDEKVYGRVKLDEVDEILSKYQ